MTAKQRDEEVIFNAARQIDSPVGRSMYLRQACGGDGALTVRIQALLRVYDESAGLLAAPSPYLMALSISGASSNVPGRKSVRIR